MVDDRVRLQFGGPARFGVECGNARSAEAKVLLGHDAGGVSRVILMGLGEALFRGPLETGKDGPKIQL